MMEWMLFRVLMVAFFILANSFFVAAEFAMVSVRETRMQQLLALGPARRAHGAAPEAATSMSFCRRCSLA